MPKANPDTSLSFEQAIDRLEVIVEQIESGEVGLEEALAQYEQGQTLIKRCRAILEKAEKRIAELTQDAEGRPMIKVADDETSEEADADAEDR